MELDNKIVLIGYSGHAFTLVDTAIESGFHIIGYCEKKIKSSDFQSFGIEYVICKNCLHLNGKYENSLKFAHSLYKGEKSKIYSLN